MSEQKPPAQGTPPAEPPAVPPVAPPPPVAAPPKVETPAPATPPTKETPPAPPTPEPPKKPDEGQQPPQVKVDPTLKLPEGSLLDPAMLERTAALVKEGKLSNEAGQALIDNANESVKSYAEETKKKQDSIVSGWAKEAEADPAIGGPDFKKNVELARRALEKFATADDRKKLDETGLGNHPVMLRIMVAMSRAMADDTFERGGPVVAKLSPERAMFKSSFPEENKA